MPSDSVLRGVKLAGVHPGSSVVISGSCNRKSGFNFRVIEFNSRRDLVFAVDTSVLSVFVIEWNLAGIVSIISFLINKTLDLVLISAIFYFLLTCNNQITHFGM